MSGGESFSLVVSGVRPVFYSFFHGTSGLYEVVKKFGILIININLPNCSLQMYDEFLSYLMETYRGNSPFLSSILKLLSNPKSSGKES